MSNDGWNQKRFDSYFEDAMEAARFGDLRQSRYLYRSLLASKPKGYLNLGSTLLNLGQVEFAMGNKRRGTLLMEAALRVFPGSLYVYGWLSITYRKQRMYHKIVGLKWFYLLHFKAVCQEQIRLQELAENKKR